MYVLFGSKRYVLYEIKHLTLHSCNWKINTKVMNNVVLYLNCTNTKLCNDLRVLKNITLSNIVYNCLKWLVHQATAISNPLILEWKNILEKIYV